MQNTYPFLLLLCAVFCTTCVVNGASGPSYTTGIVKRSFGKTKDGQAVDLYTLSNRNGVEARICNYGGIVVSLKVPDRNGHLGDVVLGYDDLAEYEKKSPFFGCMVGRYANRIAKGKFTLDGKEYSLAVNNGPNAIHGGLKGFDKVVWKAETSSSEAGGPVLTLHYLSKDGEEGYPGNLSVTAVYTLTQDNALRLDYTATTDKKTVINLTQHSYFNLSGKGDVLNYEVMIPADRFTPVDKDLIPIGELRSVEGTPLDFRKPTAIGARIAQDDEQLKLGSGYDHNWVFGEPASTPRLMARVFDPASGRVMEVLSTEPGMQFYTANHLDDITGKGGWAYHPRSAFCMEPGHFPDSPNHPTFPSVVLEPGKNYKNTIVYKFSVR